MVFNKLSPTQKKIFKWCHGENKDKYDAIICDGAVRSGKTVSMIASFVIWAMRYFDGQNFAICGKTATATERNIINPLMDMDDITSLYTLSYNHSKNCLTIQDEKHTNYFYVFGGKDESSAAYIQGMTLAGVFLDEVVLMPRSFVEQALARCSVEGSKFWFSCNPESPSHWFYKEWIQKAEEKRAYHVHFVFKDNPSLPKKIIERYSRTYTGVFYQRNVLGLWVTSEGLVYDVDINELISDEVPKNGTYFISIDYGTLNPFAAQLWCLSGNKAYMVDEYYYDGRKTMKQKTDEEYYQEIVKLAGNKKIYELIIDPSAASMIATIRKHGRFNIRKAKNDVLDGIRVTASFLKNDKIKINPKCTGTIKELGEYRWDMKKEHDTVIKENDHAMDAMRYFCYTILRREWRYK